MSLSVISLADLLNSYDESVPGDRKRVEEETKALLKTFKSISISGGESQHDVEGFLHNRAIEFDKSDLSKTHLVFATYQRKEILVGYFSIANKPLIFTKKQMQRFSNSLQKRIKRKSSNHTELIDNHLISAYLIGQLGKNCTQESLKTKSVNGQILLTLAYDTIKEAQALTGGSYIWLEYEDVDKLRYLYTTFGFSEVVDYTSQNGLKMAFMPIK